MDLLPESEMSVNEAVASVHEMYQRGHKSLKGAWKHKRQFEEFYWSKVGAANLLNSMCPLGDCERGRLLSIVTDVSHVEPSSTPHALTGDHTEFGYASEFVCDASGYWHQRNYQSPKSRIYEERIHQIFLAMVAKNPTLNICCFSFKRLYNRGQFPYAVSVCSGRTYVSALHRLLNEFPGQRDYKQLCQIFGVTPSRQKIAPKKSLSAVGDIHGESIDEVLKNIDYLLNSFSKNIKTKLR